MDLPGLGTRFTKEASVTAIHDRSWLLKISSGDSTVYRWAQLDDYLTLPRQKFLHQAPFRLEMLCRVSEQNLPGTWGFGLWNDPFNATLGLSGVAPRLPVLPNTAWFFHASPPNYLSFNDRHPAQGFLAGTFSSPLIPSALLLPGMVFSPLLLIPMCARWIRLCLAKIIREDAVLVELDETQWHRYSLEWHSQTVRFQVDQQEIFSTPFSPTGKMGLVIWIDNQYAAFSTDGKVRAGKLAFARPAWMEIDDLQCV